MKGIAFAVMIFLSTPMLFAQEIEGKWSGDLNVHGARLRLVIDVTRQADGYSATLDSPDQGVKNIAVTTTTFNNSVVRFEVELAGISYEGRYGDSVIMGTFVQGAQEYPLNLERELSDARPLPKPQEPVAPYPYYSEDVTFHNESAGITLAGTFTFPMDKGRYPAVILISGSGPQSRNEELMGHKPFLVLSDYLTRNGIAVLRFDDRGFGESTGDFGSATTADFATDVESALEFLKARKEVDKDKLGLVGHSEGGVIAPMVAAESADLAFVVLMAGSGIRGDKLLLLQEELIERALGTPETEIQNLLSMNSKIFDVIVRADNDSNLKEDLRVVLEEVLRGDRAVKLPEGITSEEFVTAQINLFTSPWVKFFLRYDPSITLEDVKCPVLAINGEKDLQVPPKENLAAIDAALKKGGNASVTVKEFKDLNHLFQESETGSPMEYSALEQTMAPVVLREIADWIKLQTQ